jgi:hypothetical protein
MAQKYKYLDKDILNKINYTSRDIMKFNRALPQEVIDALPADKFFPIIWSMIHEHIAGRAVEPHMRCMIVVPSETGSEGQTGRERLLLDMEMGMYDLLPEVELPDSVSDSSKESTTTAG